MNTAEQTRTISPRRADPRPARPARLARHAAITTVQRLHLPSNRSPISQVVAVQRALAAAGLDVPVRLWDGTVIGPDDRGYRLVVKHPWSLRAMLLPPTDRQIGEAYLVDAFDVEGSMVAALRDLAGGNSALETPAVKATAAIALLRLPRPPGETGVDGARLWGRAHTRERDRAAVQFHYDVGNSFYSLFLDEGLVYSCAYFHPDDPAAPDPLADTLHRAQARKLDLICRKLALRPGDTLLDIGCGWGSLLLHAARHYNVTGVGVTLSQRQADLARERVAKAGLARQIDIRLQDYREVDGSFDAVASVGMFEHVGAAELVNYFRACYALTAPGGRFLNHGITTGRRNAVRDLADDPDSFVSAHVFPDGALVPAHVAAAQLEQAGFELVDLEQLRPHYARTLDHWVARLEASADAARHAGGERLYRIWRAYMAGSVVGFENGDLGVVQLLGTRGDADLRLGRSWMIPAEPPPAPVAAAALMTRRRRGARGGLPRLHQVTAPGRPSGVVFLHGLGGTYRYWTCGAPPLPGATYLDLYGFGDSPRPLLLRYTVDRHVAALRTALAGRRHLVLVGHSLGASLALAYAARYPDDVDALVLLAVPHYGGRRAAFRWLRRHPTGWLTTTMVVTALVCVVTRRVVGPLLPRLLTSYPRAVAEDLVKHNIASSTTSLWDVLYRRDLSLDAESLPDPIRVRLVHGSADQTAPLHGARALVAQRPAWTLEMLPGVDHHPWLRDPNVCMTAIAQAAGTPGRQVPVDVAKGPTGAGLPAMRAVRAPTDTCSIKQAGARGAGEAR